MNGQANINKEFFKFLFKNEVKKDIIHFRNNNFDESRTKLDKFKITINPEFLNNLNSNLPKSGRSEYYTAYLKINDQEPQRIKLRYRGDNSYHWFYEKKSLRIKLKKGNLYKMERKLNIVNPPFTLSFGDVANYKVSRNLGIISPEFYSVLTFINGEYMGVYHFLSQVDESLIRKHKRMPGSIYSGEPDSKQSYGVLKKDNKVSLKLDGKHIGIFDFFPEKIGIDRFKKIPGNFYSEDLDKRKNYPVFSRSSGIWESPDLWPKIASRNAEQTSNRKDINFFLNSINKSNNKEFYDFFNKFINKEVFYKYTSLDRITGSFHHDNIHNQRWYFDPYTGKFEPIQWDLRYWNNTDKNLDVNNYPLLQYAKLNPILSYELDKQTYQLYQDGIMEKLIQIYEESVLDVKNELKADKYKKHAFDGLGNQGLRYSIPVNYQDYIGAFQYNKNVIEDRKKFVMEVLESTNIKYKLAKLSDDKTFLKFYVSENSPILVDFEKLGLEVNRFHRKKTFDNNLKSDILYPGRRLGKRVNFFPSTWRGDKEIFNATQEYNYVINNSINQIDVSKISYKNLITGKKVTATQKESNISIDSNSIHPWDLKNSKKKQVILKGTINVEKDIEYKDNENIIIEPGTTFLIQEGKSIFFFGKVKAIGTENKPIKFISSKNGKAWGAIVLQGRATSGSIFKYLVVEGGSITSNNLINYTGQFNIHDSDNFLIKNCKFKNNLIGDDNLHIAYSNGLITDSSFQNSFADALDIDISEVILKNNSFYKSGNDGIDLMTTNAKIKNNLISQSGDKGISVGEWSEEVSINNNIYHKNFIGIAVKDKSRVHLKNSVFINSGASTIEAYNKNWRYDEGGYIYGENVYIIGDKKTRKDEKSKIEIELKKVDHIPSDFYWFKDLYSLPKYILN